MEPPTTQDIVQALKALGLTIGQTEPSYEDAAAIAAGARQAHIQALSAKLAATAPPPETPQRAGYLSCLSAVYCALVTASVEAEAVWAARKQLEDA